MIRKNQTWQACSFLERVVGAELHRYVRGGDDPGGWWHCASASGDWRATVCVALDVPDSEVRAVKQALSWLAARGLIEVEPGGQRLRLMFVPRDGYLDADARRRGADKEPDLDEVFEVLSDCLSAWEGDPLPAESRIRAAMAQVSVASSGGATPVVAR